MRSFVRKHAWLCPIASLALAIALLAAFGFTWWNALMAGLLLGCPLSVAWALIFGREPGSSTAHKRKLG